MYPWQSLNVFLNLDSKIDAVDMVAKQSLYVDVTRLSIFSKWIK